MTQETEMPDTIDVTIKDVPVETVRYWAGDHDDLSVTAPELILAARAALARLEEGAAVETVQVRTDDLRAALKNRWTKESTDRLRAALAEYEASRKPRYEAVDEGIFGWNVVDTHSAEGNYFRTFWPTDPNAEAEARDLCARLNGEGTLDMTPTLGDGIDGFYGEVPGD